MNNVIYKLILTTILIFGSVNITYSQENLNSISKIKYTVLDSYTKKAKPFFGSYSNEITFKLIELKNLNTESIICGVEINVSSSETLEAGNSIAFANVNGMWGVSTSTTYNNIQKSGYIFLDKNDMSNILNFLNEIIGLSKQPQDKFTLYKISVRDNFQIGMVYDPKNNYDKSWEFIFEANQAYARMKYEKGFPLLLSLSKFNKFLNKKH